MQRLVAAAAVLGGFAVVVGFVTVVEVVAGSGDPNAELLGGGILLGVGLLLLVGFVRRRSANVWVTTLRVVGWSLLVLGGFLAVGHIVDSLAVWRVAFVGGMTLISGTTALLIASRGAQEIASANASDAPFLVGSALESPGIRESLWSYKRNSQVIVIAGVGVLVAAIAVFIFLDARQNELERTGERVSGIVLDFSWGNRLIRGSITVEFDQSGERRTARIWLNGGSPRYDVGSRVDVVVDRNDPDRVSVIGEANDSPLVTLPTVFALIAGSIVAISGIGALMRFKRQRQLLSLNAWTNAPARAVVLKSRGWSQRCLVKVETSEEAAVLTVADRTRTRLKQSGLLDAATVDYVGNVARYIVLRSPGSTVLLSARHAFTRRAQRTWERVFSLAISSEQ